MSAWFGKVQEGRSFAESLKVKAYLSKNEMDVKTLTENGQIVASVLPKANAEIPASSRRTINICKGHLALDRFCQESYLQSLVEYLSTSFAPKWPSNHDKSNSKYSRREKSKNKSSPIEESWYVPLKLTLVPDRGELVIETSSYHIESTEKLLKEKVSLTAKDICEEGHRDPYLAQATLFMKAGGELKEVTLPEDAKTITVFINEKEKEGLRDDVREVEKLSRQFKGVIRRATNKPGLWGFIRFRSELDASKFMENTWHIHGSLSFKKKSQEVPKRCYEITLTRHIEPSAAKYLYIFIYDNSTRMRQKLIHDEIDVDGATITLHKRRNQAVITASNITTTLSKKAIKTILDYLKKEYRARIYHFEYASAAPSLDPYIYPKYRLNDNAWDFYRKVMGGYVKYHRGRRDEISSNDSFVESFTLSKPEDIDKMEKGLHTDDVKLLQYNADAYGSITYHIKISHIVIIKKIIYSVTAAGVDTLRQNLEEKSREAIVLTTEKKKNGDTKVIVSGSPEVTQSLNKAARVLENIIAPVKITSTKDHRLCMESPLGRATVRNLERENDVKILFEGTKIKIYGSPIGKQNSLRNLRHMIEDCMKRVTTIDLLQYGDGRSVMSALQKKFGFHLDGLSRRIGSLVALDASRAHIQVKGFDARKRVIMVLNDLVFEAGRDLTSNDGLVCVACFSQPEWPFMKLAVCGHVYCWECLEGQIAASLSSRDIPIMCAEEGCNCLIPWQDLKMVLRNREDAFHKLLGSALGLYVFDNKEAVAFCPTPGCDMFYYSGVQGDTSTIKCPSCSVEVCTVCQTMTHPDISCLENRRQASDFPQDLKEWMEEESGGLRKFCPKCTHPIEKNGGCPHVVCTACRTNICWNCDVSFMKDEDLDEHFNSENHYE